MNKNKLTKQFLSPPAEFRGKSFWAWNGKLDENELRRQIRVFKEMGLGGFFMHSRLGLATAYLSKEWFDMIRASIDEAQKCGIEAWIYDEDRYPSGAAGGLVTKNPEYRRGMLRVTRHQSNDFSWPEDTTQCYIFAATFQDEKITWYQKLSSPDGLTKLPCDAEIIIFQHRSMPNMSWYNGFTYLDTMNPEAVAKFIEVTHEAYRREVGEHFGKTVPGIFTDEPNPGPVFQEWFENDGGEICLSWTGKFPQRFSEIFGDDLTAHLPEIAYDLADNYASRTRYHYYICRARLFVDAFSKQVGKWCEENNLLSTGHSLCEEPANTVKAGGACMQFYPYMQVPGIDILTQYELDFTTAKQCSSVARQMGRKWVLSELYGGTGWETTFETYKHVGDWQAVLGVTLRCLHLSFYSMAGEAKRDFPASINSHCPWWKQFHYVEDYFSRLNVILTAGEPVCDLVVIHPIESYYLTHNLNWQENETIKQMNDDYSQMVCWLLGEHLDFDFTDEHLLIEFASTVGTDDDGAYLQIGKMKYRAVLVPPLLTMRQTTLQLLQEFSKAGGNVVFAGNAPHLLDVEPSGKVAEYARNKSIPFEQKSIVESLQDTVRCVSICDNQNRQVADIFYQLRQIDGNLVLFVVNTNRKSDFEELDITIQTSSPNIKQLQLWDAVTGQKYELPGTINKQNIRFNLALESSGSALIVASSERQKLRLWQETPKSTNKIQLDQTSWQFELDDHNVLVLDRPDCTAQGQGKELFKRDKTEIVWLDRQLRDHFEIEQRGGWMVQPWAAEDKPMGPSVDITLTYEINIETVPDSPLLLALEQPERWQVQLNGLSIDSSNISGWWVDPAIKTLPVDTNLLHPGENVLTFNGQLDRLSNPEIVYLLGKFGTVVKGSRAEITKQPNHLKLGSWLGQGLSFYSGNVTYRSDFKFDNNPHRQYLLDIPNFAATLAEVKINDNEPVIIGMPQGPGDITPYLHNGKNTIEIKLFGSRRNAFGPLHITENEPFIIGSLTFQHDPKNWQEDYKLIEYGLFKSPVILEI